MTLALKTVNNTDSDLEMLISNSAENKNLLLYNMMPFRRYQDGPIGIENMTAYVRDVADMGFNTIWVNPLQKPGNFSHLHPNGKNAISGSLYAMADQEEFNPLIFPGCKTKSECESKLIEFTDTVRSTGMVPIFDLVLNHVGCGQDDLTPLQKLLADQGLLLQEKNERWPDIQGIDYYRDGSTKRGINTEPKDLDFIKIDKVFELLWKPFIERYINQYGFMGVRVDALTHVPVPVQQRAHQLVKDLVRAKYKTDAIIVGELMISNPESYIPALSACNLTHCLNPYSYFWSPNSEGGYLNSNESAFFKNNQVLTGIVQQPICQLEQFTQLSIEKKPLNPLIKLQKNTVYIHQQQEQWYLTLNRYATDFCFNRAFTQPLTEVNPNLIQALNNYLQTTDKLLQRQIKKDLLTQLSQSSQLNENYCQFQQQFLGEGLIGFVGNHDVGTLKAKIMLDTAYSLALSRKEDESTKELNEIYKNFKNIIKGISNTIELEDLLQINFHLSAEEIDYLYSTINLRMQEKIFIQSMACMGGWYALGGDELGVCHKPEVFSEYANDEMRVGSSLHSRAHSPSQQHDLRPFISAINSILTEMPRTSPQDSATLFLSHIEDNDGQIPVFMVLRYHASTKQHYLIAHCPQDINETYIFERLTSLFDHKIELYYLDAKNRVHHPIPSFESLLLIVNPSFETPANAIVSELLSTNGQASNPYSTQKKSKNSSLFFHSTGDKTEDASRPDPENYSHNNKNSNTAYSAPK